MRGKVIEQTRNIVNNFLGERHPELVFWLMAVLPRSLMPRDFLPERKPVLLFLHDVLTAGHEATVFVLEALDAELYHSDEESCLKQLEKCFMQADGLRRNEMLRKVRFGKIRMQWMRKLDVEGVLSVLKDD